MDYKQDDNEIIHTITLIIFSYTGMYENHLIIYTNMLDKAVFWGLQQISVLDSLLQASDRYFISLTILKILTLGDFSFVKPSGYSFVAVCFLKLHIHWWNKPLGLLLRPRKVASHTTQMWSLRTKQPYIPTAEVSRISSSVSSQCNWKREGLLLKCECGIVTDVRQAGVIFSGTTSSLGC